jgi:hypothetical protein
MAKLFSLKEVLGEKWKLFVVFFEDGSEACLTYNSPGFAHSKVIVYEVPEDQIFSTKNKIGMLNADDQFSAFLEIFAKERDKKNKIISTVNSGLIIVEDAFASCPFQTFYLK